MKFFNSLLYKRDQCIANTSDLRVTVKRLIQCSTPEARSLVPYDVARNLNVLPLGLMMIGGRETLTAGTPNPNDAKIIHQLRFITDREVRLLPLDSEVTPHAIFSAYNGDEKALSNVIQLVPKQTEKSSRQQSSLTKLRDSGGDIGKLLETLIDYSASRFGSDIHLIPKSEGTFIQLRVDGELLSHEEAIGPRDLHNRLINRIKVLSHLDTTVHGMPQEGGFATEIPGGTLNIRVSILPTLHGEKAVLRILGNGGIIPFEDLGIDDANAELIRKKIMRLEGTILFGGPTGSGKSTTMYSALKLLDNRGLSIATVEDPIECAIPFASQTAINERIGLTFPVVLKTLLRQDPDVLLIGEVRDPISAKIALEASLTGHLILSSIHARSAPEAFIRIKQLVSDETIISQAVDLIVVQALIPTLCRRCKVTDLMGTHEAGIEVFKGVGCVACDYSGFEGRALAIETLDASHELKLRLLKGEHLSRIELEESGVFHPINRSTRSLLVQGKISLEHAKLYQRD